MQMITESKEICLGSVKLLLFLSEGQNIFVIFDGSVALDRYLPPHIKRFNLMLSQMAFAKFSVCYTQILVNAPFNPTNLDNLYVYFYIVPKLDD